MAATNAPRGRRRPETRPTRTALFAGVVIGVIALALVATVAFGTGGGPSGFSPGNPEVVGGSLPTPGAVIDPAVGMRAPAIRGQGFDGEPVAIEFDGVAKGILFLAHWCTHCRDEVPEVQRWLDGGGGVPGAEIVSVATAFDEAQAGYPPDDWLDGEGWTPPVVVDDEGSSVYRAYGGGGFPYWVFVSGDGSIVTRVEGRLSLENLTSLLQTAAAS